MRYVYNPWPLPMKCHSYLLAVVLSLGQPKVSSKLPNIPWGGQCPSQLLLPAYWIATDSSVLWEETMTRPELFFGPDRLLLMKLKTCLLIIALTDQVGDSYFQARWLFTADRFFLSLFGLHFLNPSSPTKGFFKHLSHADG